MKARALFLAMAVCILVMTFATGCVSGSRGDQMRDTGPRTPLRTKADIYARLGVPEEIRNVGEEQYLLYILKRERGGSFAVGYIIPLFSVGREHTAEDTLLFRIDSQGNAMEADYLRGTGVLRGSIWPFGT